MDYIRLTEKKQALDAFRPLAPELVRNLDDWFKVELTFTSNAIEGNTLTRRETAVVIEKGLTVNGKSLKEHLEATNHGHALDFVHTLVRSEPSKLSANAVLEIHTLILKGIDEPNAGRYRAIPVRISGSAVAMPNPRKVPDLMKAFHEWLKSPSSLHPVAFAGEAHYRMVTIHPFVDGNGRTARLLMNLLLMMRGYPPAIIRKQDRLVYLAALEKAQLGGSRSGFDKLICKAVDRSLDIYLKAAQGESATDDVDSNELLKIGELAKAVGETVPTIRHWTKEHLLEIAEHTESGHQLYAGVMIQRCQLIQQLKSERYSLQEIRRHIAETLGHALG